MVRENCRSVQVRVVREIRTLGLMWRGLETGSLWITAPALDPTGLGARSYRVAVSFNNENNNTNRDHPHIQYQYCNNSGKCRSRNQYTMMSIYKGFHFLCTEDPDKHGRSKPNLRCRNSNQAGNHRRQNTEYYLP